MVAIHPCPTQQPAGAAWYRWASHSDTPMTLSVSRVYDSFQRVMGSELNPLATHAPWGLMQRLSPLHECGGAEMPPHSWTRLAAPTERTRDRDAFPICITSVQQQNEEQRL